MGQINQIKRAIISRLQRLSDRVRIVGDDTDGEAGSKSQVRSDYILRVGYANGSFTPPNEDVEYQSCDRAFQVAIEMRDLRSEDAAVDLIDEIESLLMGFRPCVDGVIGDCYLQSDRFVQNREGVYFYAVNIVVPTIKTNV